VFNWRAFGESEILPWAREIHAVTDTCQGLIGHDTLAMPRVRHSHSGYGGGYGSFEGHRKEDVTSKVLDPSFANFD